jgi:hypothetical protein
VDHIVPRNQGGSDDLSNLQALCFRCNAAKRWEAGCVFCALEGSGRVLLENELALCIAERMHMSHVVKRFIDGEFTEVQCLTTNAFRFSSIRPWASNSRFNSGRTRSSRAVRSWLPMLPVATIKSLAGVPLKR